MKNTFRSAILAITVLISFLAPQFAVFARQDSRGSVSGVVRDEAGALVTGAKVWLIHTQQAVLSAAVTDGSGRFRFESVLPGSYEIRINQRGFSGRRVSVEVPARTVAELDVVLEVDPLRDDVTVTAEAGQALNREQIAQAVNVIPQSAIIQRTTAVLAQAADEEVGVALQRTAPSMGAIFVRGLTGKNVATYVDGVRFTMAAGRGGVNTFFNLNEPSSLRAMEILRGPNSAQYGSDSLGGTVSLLSHVPVFGGDEPEFHGEVNAFSTSSDASFGSNALFEYGTKRYGLYGNFAGRRVNTLRSANGLDGHSAITRFLGLPSDVIGERLPDTAFTQYSGTLHFNYALRPDQQLIFHYQRSQQDGGKRYDQLVGGDGNLQADLRNLMLDFFYGRYVKQNLGIFDNGSFTFSYNSQREERVNQGGQGNPFGAITHQYERTSVWGFSFFVDKQLSRGNTLLIGGDVYRDGVKAPAYTFSPTSGLSVASRPRVPDGSRYLAMGLYVQDTYEIMPNRWRLSGALRYNVASYRSRAENAAVVGGQPLFPDDSLRVSDFSGRIGTVVTPTRDFSIKFNYSRGFRSPNITDLGTLGLTGDGFEADFASSFALGGTIGSTANAQAISTGIPVSQQQSEVSNNFDLGFRYHHSRFDTELTGFLIDINDAIVKQALILPASAAGQTIGGQPIPVGFTGGVLFVPLAPTTPVLVRANFTNARIWGLEYTLDARLSKDWSFGGNFTYIRAEDKANGAPPNIEGGTPPTSAFLRLRYEPVGQRYWIEGYSTLADRQNRLSTLDLGDRRTGAPRSRNNIRDFFRRGGCMRGLVAPGPDGICGTNDETILLLTGETLTQVQNRILPIGATINGVLVVDNTTAVPLFRYLPGYALFNVRGGYRFNESSEFSVDFENIGDKGYRNSSWGIDGPGRSVTVRYRYKF
jgi:hemoglobin/transferrin/lactoferrin receptor protein